MRGDFAKFWFGQTVNNFGTSISQWALPLIVFELTHSAIGLGVAFALNGAPYLLFGLPIGAWVDRLDRRKVMIASDLVQAALIASIPALATFSELSVGWVYAVGFLQSTVYIFFSGAEFAAIPSLVAKDDLVSANGRIQASYSAAQFLGPVVAGVAVALIDVERFLLIDAATFLVSAISVSLIRKSFNQGEAPEHRSIVADVKEGLRYVVSHPVLRNISLMMAIVNFIGATVWAQLVLFSKERLSASDSEYAVMVAAGSAGIILLSLLAGPLRKRFSFSLVALGALAISGVMLVVMAMTRSFVVAVVVWGVASGLGILFNINTGSLRQTIVPGHMLGRIITIAAVLAWSANPLGALLGSFVIEATGSVEIVFLVIGLMTVVVPLLFALGPLGRADTYITAQAEQSSAR